MEMAQLRREIRDSLPFCPVLFGIRNRSGTSPNGGKGHGIKAVEPWRYHYCPLLPTCFCCWEPSHTGWV